MPCLTNTYNKADQLAGRDEIARLAAAGATLLTHLGNGCPGMLHRHDNHLWPSLAAG